MSVVNLSAAVASTPMKLFSLPSLRAGLRWSLWGLFNALALYLVVALYAQQQLAFALLGLVVTGIASYVFISRRAYAHRYIYPALAGMRVLQKGSRLSITPVEASEWACITDVLMPGD